MDKETSTSQPYIKIEVCDNEAALYNQGYNAEALIEEMNELTNEQGVIWDYSEQAHTDYIREKMSVEELKAEFENLGGVLEEFLEEEEED